MNLTARQIQIVTKIDKQVARIIKKKKTSQAVDEAIIEMTPDHMNSFKHLLDTLDSDDINKLCQEYYGFYRFTKMLERIAEGCRDGLFDDIIK